MANLDMSLDDIISKNKTFQSRPRSSRPGPSPARRFTSRSSNRAVPYSSTFNMARAPTAQWDHNMIDNMAALTYPNAIETGTKLLVSNLDYGVTDEDIKNREHPMVQYHVLKAKGPYVLQKRASPVTGSEYKDANRMGIASADFSVSQFERRDEKERKQGWGEELFADVGDLTMCSVNYDRSGRSEGTAEVVFRRRRDAEAAIMRYNNVQLDGKPMKIEIIGANLLPPPVLPPAAYGSRASNPAAPIRNGRGQGRGRAPRQTHGRAPGMRRGHGRGRDHVEKISAEDLDADLDKYHAASKETD